MKDSKYVTDFVKTVYTESTELCMTAFDEKECLQDATILINQLRAENKQLREGVKEYKDLLEWFLNLANGCSKSGGKATQQELEECIEQAGQALKEVYSCHRDT